MLLTSISFFPAIGAIAAFMLVYVVFSVIHGLWFSEYSHIPGPRLCKVSRLWLVYFDVRLQRTAKVHEWHEKYGPVILVAPGEVSFSEPSTTREIYRAPGRHPKSGFFDNFIAYGERATFNSLSYEEHREKRNHSFAFFQASSIYLPRFVEPIRGRMVAFLDQIRQDIDQSTGTITLDFFQLSNRYAFDNITRLVLGSDYCTRTIETPGAERVMLDDLKYCEALQPLLFNFPPAYYVLRLAASIIYHDPHFLTGEHSLTEWNTKRVSDKTTDTCAEDSQYTLLGKLQGCRTKLGEPLPASWINAELLDNLNAAQMTVTVTLTYVLWNLARNPEWQVRIRKEIAALPSQEDGFPSFGDINKAPILEACIKESYRLNPISSGRAERVVPVGKEYDGVFLPRGTIVSTSTLAIQHSRSVFTQPHIYNPDRWLQANPDQLRTMERFYIPFGYGARVCLGKAFATVEVKLLVACLLLEYKISEDPSSSTDVKSMAQLGTQDALPKGLRCDLKVQQAF
ncbi:cytochrome P450 CYP625A1 [Periconia macrospinosa]|uniref:Cytochrome P450 CYP625A1 n=1 Tax=Periconia macrospinosa TaxID=97972 RepID=A0A2V1DVS3_9PLEO|nr:cytochrome P450 CYP625A1 [Periconia macrospinosa]